MKALIVAVIAIGVLAVMFFVVGAPADNQSDNLEVQVKSINMRILSAVFNDGENIPPKFTCDGDNTLPGFSVSGVPEQSKSLVFIMDDPDSPTGTWDHWIIFNVSPDTKEIAEGKEPAGIRGKNSWGEIGYGGPCPGRGSHRYFFKVYALDSMIDLSEGTDKSTLLETMQGHILDSAELMGRYEKVK